MVPVRQLYPSFKIRTKNLESKTPLYGAVFSRWAKLLKNDVLGNLDSNQDIQDQNLKSYH